MTGTAPVRGQDSAHRRGLVLGLTMAEIMVLILFVLLLAMTAVLARKEKSIQEKERRIATLEKVEAQMTALLRQGSDGLTVTDVITRLERQQREIMQLQQQMERTKEFEAKSKALDDIIREIRRLEGRDASPSQVVERLKQSAEQQAQFDKTLANLRGQIEQLSKQIRMAGRGNEFPSCWATAEGKTESIFDLVILPGGIVVRNRDLPHRADDVAKLPLSGVALSSELSLSNFQLQLRPLYEWSVQNRCRFYVMRYSSETNPRADLINAIDSLFYPDSRIIVRSGGQ